MCEGTDVVLQINNDELCPPDKESSCASTTSNKTADDDDASGRSARSIPLVELSLENITYAPMARSSNDKSRRQIISNVSTTISPYMLNAWMGPSGSGKSWIVANRVLLFTSMSEFIVFSLYHIKGKTSLLSVAAGLLADPANDLIKDSTIRVNGEKGVLPKNLVGVVWQEDLLLPNLTVRETVRFAARLKSPKHFSDEEVDKLVDETLAQLGLSDVKDSLIGSSSGGKGRGISGGERKRVSVAVELVAKPSVLLLDEPTSGLDSSTALQLMLTLKDLAAMGHAIAVVIHQPRTSIFDLFDNLLLLEKGQVVYEGKASGVKSYLESVPDLKKLPPETGKADWLMDLITEDEDREGGGMLPLLWGSLWEQGNAQAVESDVEKGLSSITELKQNQPKFHVGFFTQLKMLTMRAAKQQRGERLTQVTFLLAVLQIAFTSLAWGRLPDTTDYVYNKASLLFFVIVAQSNGIVISSMLAFSSERRLLSRERAKKMYGVLPYFLAKTASDMINSVALPMLYGCVVYWICGFLGTAKAFFTFALIFYLTVSAAQSTGLFLSLVIPNFSVALILAPPICLSLIILGGFYIPYDSINPALSWASWISMARYGYSAFIINEFGGRTIECAQWSTPDSMVGMSECPLPGESVIAYYGIEGVWTSIWTNVAMLVLIQVVMRVASYFLLRRAK